MGSDHIGYHSECKWTKTAMVLATASVESGKALVSVSDKAMAAEWDPKLADALDEVSGGAKVLA